jgi:hypothetical protein
MAAYMKNYKDILNRHRGRSFYNMTGFGDVSILALLKTWAENSFGNAQLSLPGMEDHMVVFTQDRGLNKKIKKEFSQQMKIGRLKIMDNTQLK